MRQKIPSDQRRKNGRFRERAISQNRPNEQRRAPIPLKMRLAWRVVFVPFVLFTILGFGLFALWVVCRDDIKKQSDYLVQCENVRVLNPPPWAPRTFVNEVFERLPDQFANEPLNSLDTKLAQALADAFRAHPLVEDVERVYVRFPAIVDVNLAFRQPVALVNVTPDARKKCYATLRKLSPEDADVMANNEPSLQAPDDDDKKAPEINAADARFIVDQTGYRLPNAYFVDHPDSYRKLPEIVGVTTRPTSEDGRSPDPLVEESAEFARFLRDSQLTAELSIAKIFVVQKQGETSPRFFFQAQNGRVVKWGRFERPARRQENVDYSKRSPKEEWNAILAKQNVKILNLIEQIEENAREIEVAAAQDDPNANEKAESLRKNFYDVSQASESSPTASDAASDETAPIDSNSADLQDDEGEGDEGDQDFQIEIVQ